MQQWNKERKNKWRLLPTRLNWFWEYGGRCMTCGSVAGALHELDDARIVAGAFCELNSARIVAGALNGRAV